uniref:Uncharacterized protein n=1 Tax=Lactuca sativa TaxID=4236 RepID=A0A9R1VGZ0_LACSA|nr:hypothetical protein LSAT_V11C500287760 [Lactuca sativa]
MFLVLPMVMDKARVLKIYSFYYKYCPEECFKQQWHLNSEYHGLNNASESLKHAMQRAIGMCINGEDSVQKNPPESLVDRCLCHLMTGFPLFTAEVDRWFLFASFIPPFVSQFQNLEIRDSVMEYYNWRMLPPETMVGPFKPNLIWKPTSPKLSSHVMGKTEEIFFYELYSYQVQEIANCFHFILQKLLIVDTNYLNDASKKFLQDNTLRMDLRTFVMKCSVAEAMCATDAKPQAGFPMTVLVKEGNRGAREPLLTLEKEKGKSQLVVAFISMGMLKVVGWFKREKLMISSEPSVTEDELKLMLRMCWEILFKNLDLDMKDRVRKIEGNPDFCCFISTKYCKSRMLPMVMDKARKSVSLATMSLVLKIRNSEYSGLNNASESLKHAMQLMSDARVLLSALHNVIHILFKVIDLAPNCCLEST